MTAAIVTAAPLVVDCDVNDADRAASNAVDRTSSLQALPCRPVPAIQVVVVSVKGKLTRKRSRCRQRCDQINR